MRARGIVILSILLLATGCSTIGKKWKALITGNDAEKEEAVASRAYGMSYKQQSNVTPSSYRKYKRTTRKDFEDNAHLESRAGSLWVMEGQGAYLFSQNVVRMIGDPVAVRIEGDPAEQLSSKARVISKLLSQLEERRRRASVRAPASNEKKTEEKPAESAANANAPGAATTAEGGKEEGDFSVKTVPTRVIERLVDGNYRVRGVQPFMIGSREYKVIVTGVVRAEDFNEDGISAGQLLDSSFDIVSSKNTEMR